MSWYLILLIGYYIGMVAIGLLARSKAGTLEQYTVAGRSLSILTSTGTQVATLVGAASTIGIAGYGYSFGLAGVHWVWGASIGVLILGLTLARPVWEIGKKHNLLTTPDWLCYLYGEHKPLRVIGTLVTLFPTLGAGAGQVIACGSIIAALTGISPEVGIISAGVILILYTYMGGMYAVAWTDNVQAVILVLGMLVACVAAVPFAGGFSGMAAKLQPHFFDLLGRSKPGLFAILAMWCATVPYFIVGQPRISRIYAAESAEAARKAQIATALICIAYAFLPVVAGMAVQSAGIKVNKADMALPTFALQHLHPVIGALVMAAVLAAAMSSADSVMLALGTLYTKDLHKGLIRPNATEQELALAARVSSLAFGILNMLLALWLKGLMNALQWGYSIGAALLFPVFLGYYWKRSTRAGAIAGLAVGSILGITIHAFGVKAGPVSPRDLASILSLAASLVAFVAVSLTTRQVEKPNA